MSFTLAGSSAHQNADRSRDERFGDRAHDVPHRAAGRARARAQFAERSHDAEHGAEEANERRIVPERAEEQEAALELLACLAHGAGEHLLKRLGAGVVPLHGRAQHLGFHRATRRKQRRDARVIGTVEPFEHFVAQLISVDTPPAEKPPTLDDHADRQHRESEQQVQDHAAGDLSDGEQFLNQNHFLPPSTECRTRARWCRRRRHAAAARPHRWIRRARARSDCPAR